MRLKGDDRENEIEDNLQTIDCMVSNLRLLRLYGKMFSTIIDYVQTRNMAVDMSAEISDQNEQLDRITIKVGSNPIFILW